MTDLAALQAAFQSAILDGDDRILGRIRDGAGAGRDTLLGVYRDAYVARLVESLCGRYRRLRAYLGLAVFEEAACAFVAARPSRSASLRGFGADLPAFLAATSPYAERPALSNLAAIDGALADAADAADGEAPARSEPWRDVVVRPHASLRRLDLLTNAFALWSALDEGRPAPDEAPLTEPDSLVVWRLGFTPVLRLLRREEAALWDAACAGVPLGRLCEHLATTLGAEAAARSIEGDWRDWSQTGRLADGAA